MQWRRQRARVGPATAAARLRVAAREYDEAEALVHQGLDGIVEVGARGYLPTALELLAAIAAGLESAEEAAPLLGAADAARAAMGSRRFAPHEAETLAVRAALTDRLGEEARLAAEGLTNPQIAERMFISRGTAKVHLSHIYAKLGVHNRSELTAMAVRRSVPVAD